MNDRRKKFMPKRHRVRFPTHGGPIPTDDFIRRRNEAAEEEENPSVSGVVASGSIDIPSTSGEETDDSKPPPGLKGKALGLWHRDRKRKEKKLRKQEKREEKAKKQKKKNVESPFQPEEHHQNGIEVMIADYDKQQHSRQADYETQLNTRLMSRDFMTPTTGQENQCRLATELNGARYSIQQIFATNNDVLNNKTVNEADDCELYGQLLAKKLRKYSFHKRHLIMHAIDGLLLRKPPRSSMLPPLSSIPSSASSHANPLALVSNNSLSEPPLYTLLPSQSSTQVDISSSNPLLHLQQKQSSLLSSHEVSENINTSFLQDTSHFDQSIVQKVWRSALLKHKYEQQDEMFSLNALFKQEYEDSSFLKQESEDREQIFSSNTVLKLESEERE